MRRVGNDLVIYRRFSSAIAAFLPPGGDGLPARPEVNHLRRYIYLNFRRPRHHERIGCQERVHVYSHEEDLYCSLGREKFDDLIRGAEMAQSNPLVPWTDEQWARVNQVIQEEAQRARVAATFLPLYGPLPASADFVRKEDVSYQPLRIADKETTQLETLQLKVRLRGEQLADPEMTSALTLFRRAANIIARLEDALVFNGFEGYDPDEHDDDDGNGAALPYGSPNRGEQIWGGRADGLVISANDFQTHTLTPPESKPVRDGDGNGLVKAVSDAIGDLETQGHFGPFAVVLSQNLFSAAQVPVNVARVTRIDDDGPSSVPQDRIVPLLGGGPLLRSSALLAGYGVVVALGGAPIELVVATDVSLQFVRVTDDAHFIFRVYEKVSLRIKEVEALVALVPPDSHGSRGRRRAGGQGASPPPPPATER